MASQGRGGEQGPGRQQGGQPGQAVAPLPGGGAYRGQLPNWIALARCAHRLLASPYGWVAARPRTANTLHSYCRRRDGRDGDSRTRSTW